MIMITYEVLSIDVLVCHYLNACDSFRSELSHQFMTATVLAGPWKGAEVWSVISYPLRSDGRLRDSVNLAKC